MTILYEKLISVKKYSVIGRVCVIALSLFFTYLKVEIWSGKRNRLPSS